MKAVTLAVIAAILVYFWGAFILLDFGWLMISVHARLVACTAWLCACFALAVATC